MKEILLYIAIIELIVVLTFVCISFMKYFFEEFWKNKGVNYGK